MYPIFYKADFPLVYEGAEWDPSEKITFNVEDYKWKPSIFMPKTACRLFLKIKSIRVERLQSISEGDAVAEGMKFTDFGKNQWGDQKRGWHYSEVNSADQCLGTAKWAFGNLWQSINGPESWAANPWVWVVEFEKCEKPENFN